MMFHSTAGPDGFGPSPAFGRPHTGIKLTPAQTRPLPGRYSGPLAITHLHFWICVTLAVAAAIAVAVLVTALRRRP
jgi:hypothetical protein